MPSVIENLKPLMSLCFHALLVRIALRWPWPISWENLTEQRVYKCHKKTKIASSCKGIFWLKKKQISVTIAHMKRVVLCCVYKATQSVPYIRLLAWSFPVFIHRETTLNVTEKQSQRRWSFAEGIWLPLREIKQLPWECGPLITCLIVFVDGWHSPSDPHF